MAKIDNLTRLLRKLEKLERDSRRQNNGNVIVGYAASYAIYVHETPPDKAAHKPGKQWKFLEQPAREKEREIAQTVVEAVKRGHPLLKALLRAGEFLQAASQRIVPVKTGNLKGSAFTELE